ncbi:MAG TPA: hypothetical protein GX694_09655 [Actinomycetales bacterium]|nr:hypothetical protein [Actinomycetales bacterium]
MSTLPLLPVNPIAPIAPIPMPSGIFGLDMILGGLAAAASVGGLVVGVSQPHVIDGIRGQINGALAPHGIQI